MVENQTAGTDSRQNSEIAALRRDLSFSYRLHVPQDAGSDTLILLHGSAADETTLMPLAMAAAPRARLAAVRGRIIQDGDLRWFRRITPTQFDQVSIRTEAHAFAHFIDELITLHSLEPANATFIGYSNGANLVSSTMLLHPGAIRRAVLLRAMPVLDQVPNTDLSDAHVLMITGANDVTYSPFAPALAGLLRAHHAEVDAHVVAAGHEFGAVDGNIISGWLDRQRSFAST
ncbi:MAG TPA: alpha/beta hydrolase [Mesorhizobium sp.]|jgi:phospholipase/carboxylesterase|uniref:alpha/beta hydrolase n=1 Tax=Mesorhizobium sp. TaxID=1871066 RepID=UPI002DDCB3DC|nr:alpha/beta hydrolase [Mesorhizobium sp.]HEV2504523.1 alpha/beta hydrolase [Mesorhizobium sp.]